MTDTIAVGAFLMLYQRDGYSHCLAADEPIVAAAMARLTAGDERAWSPEVGDDAVVEVRTLSGVTLKVLASNITSWYVSTPETRRRELLIGRALQVENADLKPASGDGDPIPPGLEEITP